MHDTIPNYNDRNHMSLSNAKIREANDKVILEHQVEENNVAVDMFSPQRNKSDNLIDKVQNLTINNVGNDLIEKVANLTINDIGNNLIDKVTNLTINGVGNDSNRAIASDVQVQFLGDSAGISHQNLFSGRMIGIRHEEVPVLVPHTGPIIISNNRPAITVITGFIQVP